VSFASFGFSTPAHGFVSRIPFFTANEKMAPSKPVTRLALPGDSECMKFSTTSFVTDVTFIFPSFGLM
jgi:hypothetical protein